MSQPIPVVLCGQYGNIAEVVKEKMQPEYEVVHTVLSVESGVSDIPAILRGEQPPSASADIIGTKNYSSPAKAVVTGGNYDDDGISKMRDASKGSQVPWLRYDSSKPAPPPGPAAGAALVERVKTLLNKLAGEGKLQEDGVYWY